MRRAVLIIAAAVALLATPDVASAASYTVNDPGDFPLANPAGTSCVSTDGGNCTLRAAVQAADNSGGSSSITLPAGTYTLTIPSTSPNDPSTGDLDVKNKVTGAAISVSGSGSGSTVIDAHHIDRAFAVQTGSGLTLSGLTIENGSPSANSSGSQNGGAIYSDGALTLAADVMLTHNAAAPSALGGGAIYADIGPGSSVSVTDTTAEDNAASAGGAIFDDAPNTMTIEGSHFSDNTAITSPGIGGAIERFNGAMTIDSSTFTGNSALQGGAIDLEGPGGQESITNSSFDGNSANGGTGGAVADFGGADVGTFTGDRFRNSSATVGGGAFWIETSVGARYAFSQDQFDYDSSPGGQGGAMYIDAGVNNFNGSSFIGDNASQGGAIWVQSAELLALVNTTMSDNSATDGGAIDNPIPTPATLTNDTIAFNTAATGHGGGIAGADLLMTGSGGAGVENTIVAENGGGDCATSFTAALDQGHNLDSDNSCFGGLGGPGDKPAVNPLLGAPADNGGLVAGAPGFSETIQTDAELTGSPAINAASNVGCPATDERGVPRPQGPACDIGAYEATPPIVATNASTGVSAGAATLNGTVNPANLATTYHFDYGTSTNYGSSTPSQNAGSDYAVHAESVGISGLRPGVTYHFRIVATNAVGTSFGADQTFTTMQPPTVVTGPSSGVGSRSATVSGSVNPNGEATSYQLEYGTSTRYGSSTATHGAGSGTSAMTVSAHLMGLRPGAIYHYRLVATSAGGTTSGSDRTFHTKAVIAIAGVSSVGCTRASSVTVRVRVTTFLRGRTTVRLDGRLLARGSRSLVRVRVALSSLGAGRHTITVTTSSRAGTTTRRSRFAICAVIHPVFTG